MHLRNALVLLSIIALLSHAADTQAQDTSSDAAVTDAAVTDASVGANGSLDGGSLDASASEAGSADASTTQQDAGGAADAGKITHPGEGEENDAVIDEYADDHGCSCATVHRRHGADEGLSSLAFAAALVARARRRRRKAGAASRAL